MSSAVFGGEARFAPFDPQQTAPPVFSAKPQEKSRPLMSTSAGSTTAGLSPAPLLLPPPPQSSQSVPKEHNAKSEPGPPSSQ